MKQAFTLTLCLLCTFFGARATGTQEQHGAQSGQHANGEREHNFGAREFDRFHDILHPLQHEALPNNDFRTIRARAADLVAAGRTIIRMPVPRGIADATAFRRERRNFNRALMNYRRDAQGGTDAQLRVSYEAVHDKFEELAQMLPRR